MLSSGYICFQFWMVIVLFVSDVIGQSNCFSFGFLILSCKLLYQFTMYRVWKKLRSLFHHQ